MLIVAAIQFELEDGSIKQQTREFGTFPQDRRKLAKWLKDELAEFVVMESTGVYWKAVYRTSISAWSMRDISNKSQEGKRTSRIVNGSLR